MQTTTIKIKGMTCMGCVNSVKTVLKNQPGVIAVEASLEPAQAIAQYDTAHCTEEQLKSAIVDAGFEVID
ncbi:MAG: heavy-metal-associated domain-containing protein [Nitrosomonas sp.]|nr:MAG: heavy-metal-associated domain-containing protein [Nitrosomonas sp.]